MRSAVVVGGGIGGFSAAIGLRRAGWRVRVLERAAAFAPVGAGITLWPNAVRALDALGVDAGARPASGSGGVRNRDGAWLSRLDWSRLERRAGGPPAALTRARLHRALLDVLGAEHVALGVEVDDVPDADLVVAADGIDSILRTRLWPGSPAPVDTGITTWRGLAPVPAGGMPPWSNSWHRDREFGIVPVADDQVYWFAAIAAPPVRADHANPAFRADHADPTARTAHADPDARTDQSDSAGQVGLTGRLSDPGPANRSDRSNLERAEDRDELVRNFGQWHDPIPELIAGTPRPLRLDVRHLPRVPASFVRGRVVLLGDAAHAMPPHLGQGGGLAIEDAVTLAAALAGTTDVDPDIDTALARYDRARRPRAAAVSREAIRLARVTSIGNPVVSTARDTVVRLLPGSLAVHSIARWARWSAPTSP